jgi:hypothetical protein
MNKKGAGRPIEFTDERWQMIMESVARGLSLKSTLRKSGMPAVQTFYNWMANDAKLLDQYNAAYEIGMEMRLNEIEDIAKRAIKDPKKAPGLKILADLRKWEASKRIRKYKDQQQIEHVTIDDEERQTGIKFE